MAAHWSRLIAPVPLSVSRSISTSSAWRLNRLYPAAPPAPPLPWLPRVRAPRTDGRRTLCDPRRGIGAMHPSTTPQYAELGGARVLISVHATHIDRARRVSARQRAEGPG